MSQSSDQFRPPVERELPVWRRLTWRESGSESPSSLAILLCYRTRAKMGHSLRWRGRVELNDSFELSGGRGIMQECVAVD